MHYNFVAKDNHAVGTHSEPPEGNNGGGAATAPPRKATTFSNKFLLDDRGHATLVSVSNNNDSAQVLDCRRPSSRSLPKPGGVYFSRRQTGCIGPVPKPERGSGSGAALDAPGHDVFLVRLRPSIQGTLV